MNLLFFVDRDLDESIKRSASDRLGDLVQQVRARTSPGVFHDMALLGLCLELSFNEKENIYKDFSVRSCAESVSVCVVYVCEMFV